MNTYGYARVSTKDQDLANQIDALTKAGAERIYSEKMSGIVTDRAQLRIMLADLVVGDLVIVTRLDRLARSTLDLLSILKEIGDRGAAFRSLADVWADTSTPHGRLMVTILGGLAEFERSLIKARTDEGHKRAKAEGVKYGRPRRLTTDQRRDLLGMYEANVHQKKIGETFGIHPKSVVRIARQVRRELATVTSPS
jgi:DNA invertase Pin-like site-specific DNA recombinase